MRHRIVSVQTLSARERLRYRGYVSTRRYNAILIWLSGRRLENAIDAVGERYTGASEDREGDRRDIVQGDSGVGADIVVILSYRMANNKGGRLR